MADIESVIKGLTEIVNSEWMWSNALVIRDVAREARERNENA